LPSTETFVSHISNALSTSTVSVSSNSFSISLPALSTTAIILKGTGTTGMQSAVSSEQILVYPNPAQQSLSLTLSKGDGTAISFYDVLGNEVKQFTASAEKTVVDISDLQNGVYFVTAKTKEGVLTKKIIVQR